MIIDPSKLDEMAKRLADVIPPGVRALQQDVEKNFRAVLQSVFTKLDLVTREEFDVQCELLARTRQKLDELEARVAAFEAQQDS